MARVKTKLLTGKALALAVAMADPKFTFYTTWIDRWDDNGCTDWHLDHDGSLVRKEFDGSRSRAGHWAIIETFDPGANWAQGGPLIEREDICFDRLPDDGHRAFRRINGLQQDFMDCWNGATKLQTGMRCFVASRLGDEVEIPDQLLEE